MNNDLSVQRLPVLCKKDFVRRYAQGEFGNASPTWDSWGHWVEAGYPCWPGPYHIRSRIKGGDTWYNVWGTALGITWRMACEQVGRQNLYISAMAPTELTVLQGEVQEGLWGWDLTYSRVKLPMREALAVDMQCLRGLAVRLLLRGAMNDLSYYWLQQLLQWYPDHVVEFSVYGKCWGTLAGYNTVFWEVRRY